MFSLTLFNPNYAVGSEIITELPALVGLTPTKKNQNGERSESSLDVFITS
jgi:hypothetical protein